MVNHPLHRLFVPLFYPFTYYSLIWLNNSLVKIQTGKISSGTIPHNNNKNFDISYSGFSEIPLIMCNVISQGYAGQMTFQGVTNVTKSSATIRIDNTFTADIILDGTSRYVEWIAIGV